MTVPLSSTRGATAECISKLKDKFGELPDDFISFLSQYDGAQVPENDLRLENGSARIREFVPAAEMIECTETVDGLPPNALPVARDGLGNFVYLAHDGVYFWHHEIEDGDEKIAATFNEFLEKVEPATRDLPVLRPGQVQSMWVDPDFVPEFD